MFPVPFPIPGDTPTDRDKLDDLQGEIRAIREAVTDFQRRLEKQAVLVRALFALLSTKQGLTEAELLDRFRRVEREKASVPARKCPDCARAVNPRTHRCVYCGAAYEVESAFEELDLGTWPALRPSEEHGITTRPGS
jgi:hypothetical protein